MELVVTSEELSSFFNVSRRTLSNWAQAGCPKLGRGKWNLKQVFDWWQENLAAIHAEERDEGLKKAKLDYWNAKARHEMLKVKERERVLISREEVARAWAERIAVVVSGLNIFCDRLPPLLEGKDRAEMREIIKEEVMELRRAYVRAGEHTPPPE